MESSTLGQPTLFTDGATEFSTLGRPALFTDGATEASTLGQPTLFTDGATEASTLGRPALFTDGATEVFPVEQPALFQDDAFTATEPSSPGLSSGFPSPNFTASSQLETDEDSDKDQYPTSQSSIIFTHPPYAWVGNIQTQLFSITQYTSTKDFTESYDAVHSTAGWARSTS